MGVSRQSDSKEVGWASADFVASILQVRPAPGPAGSVKRARGLPGAAPVPQDPLDVESLDDLLEAVHELFGAGMAA